MAIRIDVVVVLIDKVDESVAFVRFVGMRISAVTLSRRVCEGAFESGGARGGGARVGCARGAVWNPLRIFFSTDT